LVLARRTLGFGEGEEGEEEELCRRKGRRRSVVGLCRILSEVKRVKRTGEGGRLRETARIISFSCAVVSLLLPSVVLLVCFVSRCYCNQSR